MMEFFEGGSEQLSVQSELVLVDFLLFATGLPLGIAIKSRLVARLLRVGQRVDLGLWVDAAFLLFLLLFFLHALALILKRLFMFLLVLVEHVHEQLDIGHVLYSERLAHGVNLDLKLLFRIDALAALHRLIVDQVGRLHDQEAEHLLHALILFACRVLVPRRNTLVVNEFALRLSLSLVPAL